MIFARIGNGSCYHHWNEIFAGVLSKRQNHEEDFFKLCVLLKKSELYHHNLWGVFASEN